MPETGENPTWHGVPRNGIDWHPTVDVSLCIGCGMCVTGCGKGVYGYDYEREKPIVLRPTQCLVGCVTCSNVCPEGSISFPSIQQLQKMMKQRKVLAYVKKQELSEGKDRWAVNSQGAIR